MKRGAHRAQQLRFGHVRARHRARSSSSSPSMTAFLAKGCSFSRPRQRFAEPPRPVLDREIRRAVHRQHRLHARFVRHASLRSSAAPNAASTAEQHLNIVLPHRSAKRCREARGLRSHPAGACLASRARQNSNTSMRASARIRLSASRARDWRCMMGSRRSAGNTCSNAGRRSIGARLAASGDRVAHRADFGYVAVTWPAWRADVREWVRRGSGATRALPRGPGRWIRRTRAALREAPAAALSPARCAWCRAGRPAMRLAGRLDGATAAAGIAPALDASGRGVSRAGRRWRLSARCRKAALGASALAPALRGGGLRRSAASRQRRLIERGNALPSPARPCAAAASRRNADRGRECARPAADASRRIATGPARTACARPAPHRPPRSASLPATPAIFTQRALQPIRIARELHTRTHQRAARADGSLPPAGCGRKTFRDNPAPSRASAANISPAPATRGRAAHSAAACAR